MPEFSVFHIGLSTLAALAGVLIGWLARGKRCAQEKVAVNAGWQEQIEAQRIEHSRLSDQNKSLMEQVNHFKASGKDASNRARELSGALKEAFSKRDELQREIKDIRGNLEGVVAEREQLVSDMQSLSKNDSSLSDALKDKDDRIAKLSLELDNWQNRLPPLIERYRVRDEEAKRLEVELAEAHEHIHALESVMDSDETRVEPVDVDSLSDALDASNDPLESTADGEALDTGDGPHEGDDDTRDEPGVNDRPETGLRDNLKKIKGVGPAIEKTLNELGIFRFSQVAEMSEYDIDRIARRLKGFHSRIYREDWIGQARDLHEQRTGDAS